MPSSSGNICCSCRRWWGELCSLRDSPDPDRISGCEVSVIKARWGIDGGPVLAMGAFPVSSFHGGGRVTCVFVVTMQTAGRHSKTLLQVTLAVIKPDAVAHPLILQAVHQKILDNGFIIVMHKYLKWSQEESQRFYAEHSDRFFYQRVVEFMASGPMRAYILAQHDAVTRWRQLMGPTRVFRARFSAPYSIRGHLGLTDTRNTTHGSDSPESAAREITFFFPEFDQRRWWSTEEQLYRQGHYYYHPLQQQHLLQNPQTPLAEGQMH
ncbi:nucleoside diphosphate kinase 6 isoform X1 [Hypanus sabinus]|uniref:nucleoside diphosphate kinase 6 isoform X1 n=2 Tax=Hypanus sabinus TaxID=79690 RepID=UPI0028C45182|nr:nucleoside diphosphate kinase 6 isoform X1 [Hypanus sabinus]